METLKYSSETKALKEHRCDFCGDKIVAGEIYHKATHKYDGVVYDWKSHKYCSKIADNLNMYEGADEGVTQDMFMESVSEYYYETITNFFREDEVKKYSDVIEQLRYVRFRDKLFYVLKCFNSPKP